MLGGSHLGTAGSRFTSHMEEAHRQREGVGATHRVGAGRSKESQQHGVRFCLHLVTLVFLVMNFLLF